MPTVRLSGTSYRLVTPTDAPDWIDLACDATRNGALADHVIRRRVVRRISRRMSVPIVLFEDPVRGERLAGWVAPLPGGLTMYRERRLSMELDGVASRVPLAPSLPQQRFGTVTGRILDALAPSVRDRSIRLALSARGGRARPVRRIAAAIDAIEASPEPGTARALWRALDRFALLDARCGSGDRLIEATVTMTVLALACVERMSAWVDELENGATPVRRTRLADLRGVLGGHPVGDRERSLLRTIVAGSVRAADPRPELVRTARARLTELCGHGAQPLIDRVILAGDAYVGVAHRDDLAPLDKRGDGGERLLERVSALNRAATLGESDPPTDGVALLEERRSELRELLDRHTAERAVGRNHNSGSVERWLAKHRPLHPIVEWPVVAVRGGFDLVFGQHRRAGRRVIASGYSKPIARVSEVRERPERPPGRDLPGIRRLEPGNDGYPAVLVADGYGPPLWIHGDPRILDLPSLALFASERVPADLALRTLDVVPILRSEIPCVLGGFQSPLERACLDSLLPGPSSLVICPARRIVPFLPPRAWHAALADGRILLLTAFGPKTRRPTSRTASDRNRLVARLGRWSFVAHATPGGRLSAMVRSVLSNGGRVATWADRANADLVRAGAVAVLDAAELLDLFRRANG